MTVRHTGVWGATGTGKTTLIKSLLAHRLRVIILDFNRDYIGPGIVQVTDQQEMVRALRSRWNRDAFRISLDLSKVENDDPVKVLSELTDTLRKVQRPYFEDRDNRVLTLVVDELADAYPNPPPRDHSFTKLCRKGRHHGISIIAGSQRMAEVGSTFRGNARVNFFLPMASETDYQVARQRLNPEWSRVHQQLLPHHWICKSDTEVFQGKN